MDNKAPTKLIDNYLLCELTRTYLLSVSFQTVVITIKSVIHLLKQFNIKLLIPMMLLRSTVLINKFI